jgi:hypothetical protein
VLQHLHQHNGMDDRQWSDNDLAMCAIGLDTGIFMDRIAEGVTPVGRFGVWDNSTASAGTGSWVNLTWEL